MWLTQDAYQPLFGASSSLAMEVQVSQWTQNEGLRFANQAHRRHMPHRSMCAFWTLNEPWPNTAYGSVVDWFGEKKHAYYAATKSAYAPIDVSLKYESLFLVSGTAALPKMSVAIVADFDHQKKHILTGAVLNLTVHTQAGKALHSQSWTGLSLTVPKGQIGAVLDLSTPVSLASLGAELAAEVALFSLTLSQGGQLRAPRQVYTFGILKPGASVNDKMDSNLPMQPLLRAPTAQCEVTVAATQQEEVQNGAGSFAATITNHGTPPCLYMRLELWDLSSSNSSEEGDTKKQELQFHAADFSDNFVTLLAGESMVVEFFELPCMTPNGGACTRPGVGCKCGGGPALGLCSTGWNVPRKCQALP